MDSRDDNPASFLRATESPSHSFTTSGLESRIDIKNSQSSVLLQSRAVSSPTGLGSKLLSSLKSSQLLNDFFSWRHPPLMKDPKHTRSISTRPPSFHDMHLREGLRLRKVVICKELPNLISSICDYCDIDSDTLFAPGNLKQFPTKGIREQALEDVLPIIDEESLRTDYEQTVALPCSTVASTLNFGLKKWHAIFSWTSRSTVRQANGKADGFLSIIPDKTSLLE